MKRNTTYFSVGCSQRRASSAVSAASRIKLHVPIGVLRAAPLRAECTIIREKLTGSKLQLSTLSDDELKRKMDEFNDLFVAVCFHLEKRTTGILNPFPTRFQVLYGIENEQQQLDFAGFMSILSLNVAAPTEENRRPTSVLCLLPREHRSRLFLATFCLTISLSVATTSQRIA